MAWRRLLRAAAVHAGALVGLCRAQKGIASLNDPCDCMQHHDFWMTTRAALLDIFWAGNFAERLFLPGDAVNRWVSVQSCMYSPENEESHRPTALSDCIPGFLLVHIVCIQRQLLERRPERALDYAAELLRLLPFGASCIDRSDWPLTAAQVWGYCRRVRRAYAAGPGPGAVWPLHVLQQMAWSGPEEPLPGDDAEVCPGGTVPDAGVCWALGQPGDGCRIACERAGLRFRALGPEDWPSAPLMPRLLDLAMKLPPDLLVQPHWEAFECYVPSEARFHLAMPFRDLDPDWSYDICSLACPCGPTLPRAFHDVLQALPSFPSK